MFVKMKKFCVFVMIFLVMVCMFCYGQKDICIVGSGMGGVLVVYFLKEYVQVFLQIFIFEQSDRVGGCMFLVEFEGDIFEVGGFVIYFKNLYSLKFMEFLGLN